MLSCTSSSHHQVSLSSFPCRYDTLSPFLLHPSLRFTKLPSHPVTLPYRPKPGPSPPKTPHTTVFVLQLPPFGPWLYLCYLPLHGFRGHPAHQQPMLLGYIHPHYHFTISYLFQILFTCFGCLRLRTRSITNEWSPWWYIMSCCHGITQGHLGVFDDLVSPAEWWASSWAAPWWRWDGGQNVNGLGAGVTVCACIRFACVIRSG